MSNPTIYDVAREAGVGIGTVSRVINNSPRVRESTRKKVLHAMQKLGFKPNNSARMLPRSTSHHNIGVITQPFLSHHSFVERLRGVQLALSELHEKYELILYNVSSLETFVEQLEAIGHGGNVDSLIIIDLPISQEQREILHRISLPFVRISNEPEDEKDRIGTDNRTGGYIATQHLIELGHQRIAYVGDYLIDKTYGFTTSQERYLGFRQATEQNGLFDEKYIQLGQYGREPARQLTFELLDLDNPPTAIFAMSDMQAIGCMAAVRERGLSIPEDISVIGYDNIELSQYVNLTTIDQHLELSGFKAASFLLQRMHNKDVEQPQLPMPELVIRDTTRNIKQGAMPDG